MSPGSRNRRSDRRFSPTLIAVVVIALLLVVAGVAAKLAADSAAQSQIDQRSTEVDELLAGATPRDFLAFNSGRSVPDSVAKQVADASDFVSVDARADRAMIRFQPKGWWAGFTERCIVAVVTDDGTVVEATKTACVRTDPVDF